MTGQIGGQRPLLSEHLNVPDDLAYASSIGSLVDRTNHWVDQGVVNVARFFDGEVTFQEYRDQEAQLLSGLRFEIHRGSTGEILLREGLIELISRLRELDFRAATAARSLLSLRGHLDRQLGPFDRQRAQKVSAGL